MGLSDARPLTEAAADSTKSYLLYGPPGSGKTTFAAKHPGKRKLWIDVDDKIREQENLTQEERAAITVWTPNESLVPGEVMVANVDRERKDVALGAKIMKMPMGYKKTVEVVNELLKLASTGQFPYDMVCLDSITKLENHLEYLILFQHNVTIMNETLYGVARRNNQDFLFGFLRLPCDRIMITHDRHRTKRDKKGDIIEETIRPNIMGAIAEELMGYFSEGYYFLGASNQGKTYKIQTAGDNLKPARTTKGLDFEEIADPTRIFKK